MPNVFFSCLKANICCFLFLFLVIHFWILYSGSEEPGIWSHHPEFCWLLMGLFPISLTWVEGPIIAKHIIIVATKAVKIWFYFNSNLFLLWFFTNVTPIVLYEREDTLHFLINTCKYVNFQSSVLRNLPWWPCLPLWGPHVLSGPQSQTNSGLDGLLCYVVQGPAPLVSLLQWGSVADSQVITQHWLPARREGPTTTHMHSKKH